MSGNYFKISTLILLLVFQLHLAVFAGSKKIELVVSETPTAVTSNEKVRFVRGTNREFDNVIFFDNAGKFKRRLRNDDSSQSGRDGDDRIVKSAKLFSYNKKNHGVRIGDESRGVHFTNAFSVYDTDGNLLFEKRGVSHEPVTMDDNGQRVFCVKNSSPIPEYGDDGPAELVVYSNRGELIRSISEVEIDDLCVSPNGEWAVYKNSNSQYLLTIVNISKGTKYFVPYGRKYFDRGVTGYDGIDNNGNLYSRVYASGLLENKTNSTKKSNAGIKYLFQMGKDECIKK